MTHHTRTALTDALLCLLMLVAVAVVFNCFASCARSEEISYTEAYADYQAGYPATIIVSAPYCPACHALIATLRDRRAGIRFAVVDVGEPIADQDGTAGQPIPRVIVFRRDLPIVHRIGNIGIIGIHRLIGEGQ